MLTPWGEALDKNAVLQEYPRPQLVRESYYNLNGLWDYAITASDACPGAWDGEILVPFSPEAPLSGVGRILKPGQVLWYRRTLPFGKQDGRRMLLHFGAADQRAWVYVNGLLAGTHTGGYTAFTLDMTKLLRDGENILTVAVRDDTDAVPLSRGKQKTKRGGIWYTPQSGIWQTVWAEHVPENYVQALLFTPELPEGRVRWRLAAPAPKGARIEISYQGTPVAEGETDEDGCGSAVLPPEQLHLWSPEAPNLYDVTITLGDDTVRSYFAMRTVGTGKDAALRAEQVQLAPDHVAMEVREGEKAAHVRIGIPGRFTVSNALLTLGIARALGIGLEDACRALGTAAGVKGRIEVVPTPGRDFTVLIDYAHTPDGLENILRSVRDFCRGRLIVLFGCGGDRDRAKRPIMGEIAARLADVLVVTSDNPRTEEPMAIIREILAGIPQTEKPVYVEENRRRAIRMTLRFAQKDDMIVLAGKGHETYQVLGTEKIHFDEREEVAACLQEEDHEQ